MPTASADGSSGVAPFVLQLAQLASPGVLRWIGGRTGAGDHAFTQYREGARLLASCDPAAREDVISGLRTAAERSPNFLPGRALLALHEMGAAVSRVDSARVERVMLEAGSLIDTSPDLALAHLAVGRGARMLGRDSLAWTAEARAVRLQPVLAMLMGERATAPSCFDPAGVDQVRQLPRRPIVEPSHPADSD